VSGCGPSGCAGRAPPATRAAEPFRVADRGGLGRRSTGCSAVPGRALDEPPRRGSSRPSQAVAAASRPAQRTARAGHPDHHLPAGRPRVLGALSRTWWSSPFPAPIRRIRPGRCRPAGSHRTPTSPPSRSVPRCCSGGSPKRADIRLTVVGDRLLAARTATAADPTRGGRRPLHLTRAALVSHRRPAAHRRRRPDIHARGRLAYGAFDFAEDGDGTWWFLECNQFGPVRLVEADTGQPIAHSIAEWLSRPACGP